MREIVSSIIIVFSFVIIVSSYKDGVKLEKNILFFSLILASELSICFFYHLFEKWIYIFVKLIEFYLILKLVYKNKTNIIDIFYID